MYQIFIYNSGRLRSMNSCPCKIIYTKDYEKLRDEDV